MVPTAPIFGIRSEVRPLSLIGESDFGDTAISVEFMIEPGQSSAMETQHQQQRPHHQLQVVDALPSVYVGSNFKGLTDGTGTFFRVGVDGKWKLGKKLSALEGQPVATGVIASGITAGVWYNLSLTVGNGTISAQLDGAELLSPPLKSFGGQGWAAIGTSAYHTVQFDNFRLTATAGGSPPHPSPPAPTPPTPPTPPSPGPPSPKPTPMPKTCKAPYAGQKVVLYPCMTAATKKDGDLRSIATPTLNKNQAWAGVGQGLISLAADDSLCLNGSTTSAGLSLGACSSGTQYKYHTDTYKISPVDQTGVCVDVNMHTSPESVSLWGCNNRFENGANEQFDFDATTGALQSRIYGQGLCVSVCL
jgi:hypothetical protein